MNKAVKILLSVLGGLGILIAAIILIALVFVFLWPSFGGSASRQDKIDYARRAPNFYDGVFHNQSGFSPMSMVKNPEPDPKTISDNTPRPDFEFPVKTPDFIVNGQRAPIDEFNSTWLGHSTVFIQMHGMNILFDPVFSEVISPVSFAGSRRFSHPPVTVEQIPEVDILILTHDHYDHLDYDSIKKLDSKVKRYVVPLGVENHLEKWGVESSKITNMAWWEETQIEGLTIACTPSQHFSGRKLIDSMRTLWASYVLKDEFHQIFESGDSGFNEYFEKIHEKYGDMDFVLIECGQYDVQWPLVHMFPEQSAAAAKTLGAKIVQPIHWGAVILSRHGWDDPVERFLKESSALGLETVTPYIGQTVHLDDAGRYAERWWRQAAAGMARD